MPLNLCMSYVYIPNSLHVPQLQKKIQRKILDELHVRHVETSHLKLVSGLGSTNGLSEGALGETQVTSVFWVILKMANGVGYQCKNLSSVRAKCNKSL